MKAFASIEAVLALLFAILAFSLILPSFHSQPSFLVVYQQQIAQDFMEVSLSDGEISAAIRGFHDGDEASREFLLQKYSSFVGETGDYCVELNAGGRELKVNCNFTPASKTIASRIVFSGNGFFEARLSVGFHS